VIENWSSYLIPVVILGFFFWRWFSFRAVRKKLPDYLSRGAIVVDVRSPGEFQSGNFGISINIPLSEISARISELKTGKPIVLCCASGSRSGMAVRILKSNGLIDVINAGPWGNLKSLEAK
jgi:rhodanese-related sulfurtransferase